MILKNLLLFCLIVFIPQIFATSDQPCFQLLLSPPPWHEFTQVQISSVSAWLKRHSGLKGYPDHFADRPDFANELHEAGLTWAKMSETVRVQWVAQFMWEKWLQWENQSSAQKSAALSLELSQFDAGGARTLIPLDGSAEITRLSARNFPRMLHQIQKMYPVDMANLSPAQIRTAEEMAQRLAFHYIYIRLVEPAPALEGPLLSARELSRWDLNMDVTNSRFYSKLVGTSATVGFEAVVNSGSDEHSSLVRMKHDFEALKLDSSFARTNGFVLPRFENVVQMMDFFAQWDSATLDEVFRLNRMSLPNSVNTVDRFHDYVAETPFRQTFPEDKTFDRLAPFRTKLMNFVLTTQDGERLLRESFRQWLLFTASQLPQTFAEFEAEWNVRQGLNHIFTDEFLHAIHMESGLGLRIPVGVTARHFRVVRDYSAEVQTRNGAADSVGVRYFGTRIDPTTQP